MLGTLMLEQEQLQGLLKAKYLELKGGLGRSPTTTEIKRQLGARKLERAFGANAITKLRTLCSDEVSDPFAEKVGLDRIFEQWVVLVREKMESGVGKLPVSAEWNQRRCRPTESGIQKVYKLRWSELPGEFLKFAEGKPGLTDVVAFVRQVRPDQTFENNDSEVAKPQLKALDKVLGALKRWVPTEGKQYEDGYHAELLQYLRNACKFDVRQRWGDSEVDLAVMGNSKPIGIELKKGRGMSQAECDRLFGQLIRHLENCSAVVAVICHPDNGDLLDNFERNVRNVYGKLGKSVSVLKK